MKKSFIVKSLSLVVAAALYSTAALADNEVVIYTNADEEAQVAMRHALDNNGFEGQYLMQSMGTSELGGKLIAEGKNIEADVLTLSSYYLDSVQSKDKVFKDLTFEHKTVNGSETSYYAPILGVTGSMFVNTEVLEQDGLTAPKALADLAKSEYAGHISIPDITGSSTSWLLTQALIKKYGEKEGTDIVKQIEKNAGDHLEMSGSAPLKKLRAGEVAVGFGLRHQAVADKKKGLPIDYIDPEEGNFTLIEAVAVVDKGDNTNPNAMKIAECIIKNARTELLQNYPVALYQGESVDEELKPKNPQTFPEKLTTELLVKHQKLVKGE